LQRYAADRAWSLDGQLRSTNFPCDGPQVARFLLDRVHSGRRADLPAFTCRCIELESYSCLPICPTAAITLGDGETSSNRRWIRPARLSGQAGGAVAKRTSSAVRRETRRRTDPFTLFCPRGANLSGTRPTSSLVVNIGLTDRDCALELTSQAMA